MTQAMSKTSRVNARRRVARLLVSEHRRLSAWVRRSVGTQAEDVLAAAQLRALERADQLRDPERARAWLDTIVRNEIRSSMRRRSREEPLEHEPAAPEPPDPSRLCRCSGQLRGLTQGQQEVVRRVDIEGDSIGEVAVALGITANATRVRLHRARGRVRDFLEDHCGVTTFDEAQHCRCTCG
jgi:RNA polymerase sigma-70 factor (ECF subfamily)